LASIGWNQAAAQAIGDAADIFKTPLMGLIGTRHEVVCKARSHAFISEYYADLEYNDDGGLIITREHKAARLFG
jgi:5-oxoprolinase (ATP-hydrolysing) subunit A